MVETERQSSIAHSSDPKLFADNSVELLQLSQVKGIGLIIFRNNFQYQISRKFVQAFLIVYMQADGRTKKKSFE